MSTTHLPRRWLARAPAVLLQACDGGDSPSSAPTPLAQLPQSPAPTSAPSPAPAPAPTPAPAPPPQPTPAPTSGQLAITPLGEVLGNVLAQAEIGPEGVTYAKPVTIEGRPTERERNSAANLRIASQGADGAWRISRTSTSTDSDGVLRTPTTHFSDWPKVSGVQLLPGKADVKVGAALQLSISECQRMAEPNDETAVDIILTCAEHGATELTVGDWAVIGVPGGNAGVGTITGVIDDQFVTRGLFGAPAAGPGSNPVALSVGFREKLGKPPVTLVANLNIVDPNAGCSWLQGVNALAGVLQVESGWAGANGSNAASNTTFISVPGRLPRATFEPIGQIWFEGTLGQGQIDVAYRATAHLDGSNQKVEASGAPSALNEVQVRAMFDLKTCRLARKGRFEPVGMPTSSFEGTIGQAPVRWSLVPQ
jgi:hypothetical protein